MIWKISILVSALFAIIVFFIAADAEVNPFYQKSYALVIGINKYPNSSTYGDLDYARKDAEDMESFLKSQGFVVFPLYDGQATKTAILSKMQTELARLVKKANKEEKGYRILVFFAGHGHTESLGGKDWGYIVPYDGTNDSATYISMEELQAQSGKMGDARHQLFIMDACYGGLLGIKERGGPVNPERPGYLKDITSRESRQILAAGGKDQQVLDGGPGKNSVFTGSLLEALKEGEADLNGDGYITFSELESYIVPKASNAYQTPVGDILPGHGQGQFVFRSPRGPARDTPGSTTPSGARTRGSDPAGTFEMGTDESEIPPPVQWVENMALIRAGDYGGSYRGAFYMDKYEVTNEEYKKFMDDKNHKAPKYWNDLDLNGPRHPVVGVSWHDAVAYCEWVGKRLPTEAEWEYAARGGLVGKEYPWGDEEPTHDNANYYGGNYWSGWRDKWEYTAPVGSFPPNGYKLYDMAGNVWEWCQDWYDSTETTRVLRGGGWNDTPFRVSEREEGSPSLNPHFLRVASRATLDPTDADVDVGFRCVYQDSSVTP